MQDTALGSGGQHGILKGTYMEDATQRDTDRARFRLLSKRGLLKGNDDDPADRADEEDLAEILQKIGMEAGDAQMMVQWIRNTGDANIIARCETEIKSLKEQWRHERVVLWSVIVLLGATILYCLLSG